MRLHAINAGQDTDGRYWDIHRRSKSVLGFTWVCVSSTGQCATRRGNTLLKHVTTVSAGERQNMYWVSRKPGLRVVLMEKLSLLQTLAQD